VSRNQNAVTSLIVSNTDSGTNSFALIRATSSNGYFEFAKLSAATTAYKMFLANDSYIYNTSSGDIALLNDFFTGKIKFAAGSSFIAQMTLTAAGRLLLGTTSESTFLLDVNGTARVSGDVTISSGTTSQGTFIGSGASTRYTTNTGVNTNAIYTSSTGTTDDVIASYQGGSALTNLNLYIQSSGYIGTKGGLRLGAATGTDVVTQITNTWLNVAAGTTAKSQINLASSTAPTSPVNGDIWFDGTDLKMRIGGVTKTFTLV
jgi:hypothetical protein